MKRFLLAASLMMLALAASAQQALGPGTGLVSPEINPDNSVTFRYHNPKAKIVQVTGDFLPTRPQEVDFGGRVIIYNAPGVEVNNFQPTMQNSRSQSTIEIEDSFPDVMNFVEKHYRVQKGYSNTAVAGLSMGGRQSCMLSLHYPDTFGYVGLFSGVGAIEGNEQAFATVFAYEPKLYWIACAKADGCGLAAPQIGVSKQVVIVDGDVVSDMYDYLKGFRRTLINPVITEESEDTAVYSEGCLSIPGIYCDVTRPRSIPPTTPRSARLRGRQNLQHGYTADARRG